MKLKVMIPFRFRGTIVGKGQQIETEGTEAHRLLSGRVVGLAPAEQAIRPPAERPETSQPERAVKPPAERRTRKKKVDDGAGTDSTASD